MSSPIIVIGHRNPDNDAISSAVGYAYLKNELARRAAQERGEELQEYLPARLGPLPPETAQILERNGIEPPLLVSHVHSRVSDVMTRDPFSIDRNATLMEAGRLLRHHNVRALVVVDGEGTYCGLITTRMIAERYISAIDLLDSGASQMAVASDLISSLDQRVQDITETDVLQLEEDNLLRDAVGDLMRSALREAVVVDQENHAIGIVTRSDVAVRPKRRVILVDHNERRQAAVGIEEADVVEIVDHHRIADISTANPIRFLNLPVGSTATIVAMEFENHGVEVPISIARVLLSAIMTDTVLLKSPTTTWTDHQVADRLGAIIGQTPIEFGMEVFRLRGSDSEMPVEKLVSADSKEFSLAEGVCLIAQHETVDLPTVMQREQEIRTYMRRQQQDHGYEFVLFMATDILAEGSQFICEGNRRIINKAFDINCTGEGGTWMPGIISRKKQVAPRVLED